MDVTATSSATTTAQTTAAQSTNVLSGDFEMFLQMLTVQMQNQDPLNPVDSTDYATQLATFSGVEQAVLTNDLLKSLSSQLTSGGLADMAAWVGKEARVAAPGYFDGEPITLAPNPAVLADAAEIVVRNDLGVVVQRFDVPISAEPVEWAGVDTGGYPFPEGMYSFELVSSLEGEVLTEDTVEIYATVTEVRAQDGETILILDGGSAVATSQVSALRDPSV
ncbi:flagellar hook capping FlgD N-terminal domain-containing protein [Loktanella sp. S4079]|uniref:flagellar hook capping FlgD N-terminal domain-containing protein n=1 Tax=Loktanella sp. S4079 TaxID=579483 RepID=UPI0005F9FCEB|nr:flagellar hook capping FlgD N-terminal domain-containing protein [Loktanella sp. S4079]KJZ21138.1 flagellar basal body rod modification protein [Loktanella sp. S4079]